MPLLPLLIRHRRTPCCVSHVEWRVVILSIGNGWPFGGRAGAFWSCQTVFVWVVECAVIDLVAACVDGCLVLLDCLGSATEVFVDAGV